MRSRVYQTWCLAGGVAACVVVFGLAIQGAPAVDGGLAPVPKDKVAATPEVPSVQPSKKAATMTSESLGGTALTQPPLPIEADGDPYTVTDADVRWGRVVSYGEGADSGALAFTGGSVPPGGACTCDNDCANPGGQCQVSNCVGGVCVATNAPVHMRCDLDGLFCTDDRCNDTGTCTARTISGTSLVKLNRCAKNCSISGQNCILATDCPGVEECVIKPGGVCNDTLDRCEVTGLLGRCCVAGVCSQTNEGGCAGLWLRYEDPDDMLHSCDASLGCPKYSSGVAPEGAFELDLGTVVTSNRRCVIGGNVCEIDADCWPRCIGGANANQSCDIAADCDSGNCAVGGASGNVCQTDPDECSGADKFIALGDDYTLDNSSYLRLKEFRFRGGTDNPDEIVFFDFYDNSSPPILVGTIGGRIQHPGIRNQTIIVDCFPDCDTTQPAGLFQEERTDPPFIIPPQGYVVARAGRSISQQFGEHDSNFHWITTNAADVGTNDATRMVVQRTDGTPLDFNANLTGHPTNNNILVFELVGEKIAAPLGACCDRDTNACTDTLIWECRNCTGSGTHCDRARDCGLSQVQRCSTRDWNGPRTAADFTFGGGELCSDNVCATAACCAPDGTCTQVASAGACTGPNVLLGFGVACEPNACPQPPSGYDCCQDTYACCSNTPINPPNAPVACVGSGVACDPMSPACPGGESCVIACDGPDGANDPSTVHQITVPLDPLDPPVIVDISGDTDDAIYVDDCVLGGDDGGWIEMFEIDACAVVTISLCTNEPIRSPVTAWVQDGCPCTGAVTIFADQDINGAKHGFGSGCNNDRCCSQDGNWSGQFTLGAGTYFYQLIGDAKRCVATAEQCDADQDCLPGDVCQRRRSEYQMQIAARACVPAACCVQDVCSTTDKFDCESQGGQWLGDDDPAIADCFADPCAEGACCTGPGQCQDNMGNGITKAECDLASGSYFGGVLCQPTGDPCPICEIEDQAHCQLSATGNFIHPSDRTIGRRIADDFRPDSNTISRLCWFPCYVGDDLAGGSFECSGNTGGTPPPDDFIAVFYEDDMGIPSNTPLATYNLVPDGKLPSDGGVGNSRCWRYTAPLTPALAVTPGECYWMEITGAGETQGSGYCTVFVVDTQDGNNRSVRDSNGIWEISDQQTVDIAWCLDSGIQGASNPPVSQDGGCGNINGACCSATSSGPVCSDSNYLSCVGTPSVPKPGVFFPFETCGSFTCPEHDNDDCIDATPVCVGAVSDANLGQCSGNPTFNPPQPGEACSLSGQDCFWPGATCVPRTAGTDAYRCMDVPTDNRLATTDGPNTQGTGCFGSGTNSFQADVWYSYTAPCTGSLTIRACNDANYDMMMAIYGTHNPATSCAGLCPVNNTMPLRFCDDDFCPGSSTTSGVWAQVTKDACYMIRVGGWSNAGNPSDAGRGVSAMDIGLLCDPVPDVNPAVTPPPPHHGPKNRYVSFAPNNGATPVKFKVMKGATQIGWVGNPNSQALAMVVTADPGLRVWPEPVIHLGDCEIGPVVADYAIIATDGSLDAAPLVVPTIALPSGGKFWGDTVGSFDGVAWTIPNNIVNANDFLAALQKFQNLPTAPHISWVDVQAVSSIDPCLNYITNIADVFLLLQAFQGNNYPFASFRTTPASCPGTCNLTP